MSVKRGWAGSPLAVPCAFSSVSHGSPGCVILYFTLCVLARALTLYKRRCAERAALHCPKVCKDGWVCAAQLVGPEIGPRQPVHRGGLLHSEARKEPRDVSRELVVREEQHLGQSVREAPAAGAMGASCCRRLQLGEGVCPARPPPSY